MAVALDVLHKRMEDGIDDSTDEAIAAVKGKMGKGIARDTKSKKPEKKSGQQTSQDVKQP